jgi:hypothetical protein
MMHGWARRGRAGHGKDQGTAGRLPELKSTKNRIQKIMTTENQTESTALALVKVEDVKNHIAANLNAIRAQLNELLKDTGIEACFVHYLQPEGKHGHYSARINSDMPYISEPTPEALVERFKAILPRLIKAREMEEDLKQVRATLAGNEEEETK